jgi:hypothetical protein
MKEMQMDPFTPVVSMEQVLSLQTYDACDFLSPAMTTSGCGTLACSPPPSEPTPMCGEGVQIRPQQ